MLSVAEAVSQVDAARPLPRRSSATMLLELPLSLLGTFVLGMYVPWGVLLKDTIPGGGDNPAHPTLMWMIDDALFSHLHLTHYAYGFWGGFEAFQFYFPLPYVCGAALSHVVGSNIAFKLVTVFGLLGLPPAFYWMARSLRMPLPCRILAGLSSIPFLFTEAHVMWGGNVYSALAGMIGNAWAFVFYVPAFGKILQARREEEFSVGAVVLSVLAALSHFYALLMLLVLFVAFALQDGVHFIASRRLPWRAIGVYAIGVVSVLLMCWWIIPLLYYRQYSSEFGADWNIHLLSTFTTSEKVFFAAAILTCIADLVLVHPRDPARSALLVFVALYLVLFVGHGYTGTTAFVDVRIWPTIYLSGFMLIIFAYDTVYRHVPLPAWALLVAPLWVLVPSEGAFGKAESWMKWNYAGIEQAPAWSDLKKVIDILRREPPGRISYESSADANGTLGSVRTPELLPYLTGQDIILGGIVNSATYPGIGYMHQCLMSDTCAGWPLGSIMPSKDIPKAIHMMRSLGIGYHITLSELNRGLFLASGQLEELYHGRYVSLFRLKEVPSLVEVFAAPLPVFCSTHFETMLLNLPRFDFGRDLGLVFARDCSAVDANRRVDRVRFFNALIAEWDAGRRTLDLSWQDRTDRIQNRLNAYVFWMGHSIDQHDITQGSGVQFFVGDRPFDRDLFLTSEHDRYSEVVVPLLRESPGKSTVLVDIGGYRAFVGTRELENGKPHDIAFDAAAASEPGGLFQWITFKTTPGTAKQRFIQLSSADPLLRSGFPGTADPGFPERVTASCHPVLERGFHRLVLHTGCVGKPHLIKYSYFPKWKANVPVELGANGFMVVVPKDETTVIEHRWGRADWSGAFISLVTLLGLCTATPWRSHRRNRVRLTASRPT